MAKHILVPLDGSERAEHALPVAISIAAQSGAALVFVCATGTAELTDPEGYLFAAALAWGVPEAESFLVHDRLPAAAIQYAAAEHADPLICMTTRGRGAVSTAVLGGVATDVVRDVACPVVLVGPMMDDEPWIPGPIVAGLDGTLLAGRMLGATATLAASLDVPLWLMQVVAPEDRTRETDGTLVESAYLEETARPMVAAGLDVHWDVLHGTDPAAALIDAAQAHEARMLAVATRARTGIGGMVLGSTARTLVQQSPIPVLLTRVGD